MGKHTTNKKLIKKLNRIRIQKNCIPAKVNIPEEYNHCGLDAYQESRPKVKHIPVMERKWKCSKKPWYCLTKKENIAIEKKHKPPKMSKEDYIEAYLKQKMSKWEQKHKKPDEQDLFYKEEYPKWISAREEHHDIVVQLLNKKYINRYTQPLINKILESRFKESKEAYLKAA